MTEKSTTPTPSSPDARLARVAVYAACGGAVVLCALAFFFVLIGDLAP
jgi:hypothetical protein